MCPSILIQTLVRTLVHGAASVKMELTAAIEANAASAREVRLVQMETAQTRHSSCQAMPQCSFTEAAIRRACET